jgi:hypothetical protein
MPRNSTEQVLGFHNKSDKPQPGINAYKWELLTAVVRLHIVKFMPSPHPEKNERAHNPDEMTKGVFMADAAAALEHEIVKTLGSYRLPSVQVETLELKSIMNEIIPMNEWHFRSAAELNLPILDDPADYQHRMQLRKMTATKDKSNDLQRWSTTALEFTASVHKPKDKLYWAAARRALLMFDWMGHERNRANLASHSPVQQAYEA